MGIWKGFLELLKQADNLEIRWGEQPVTNNYYYITVNNRVLKVTEEQFKEHVKQNQLIYGKKLIQ